MGRGAIYCGLIIMKYENDVLFSERHSQTRKKKILVLLSGVEPKAFPLLSSDALPLSYRRLVGARAKDSWEKQPAYCSDLNVR